MKKSLFLLPLLLTTLSCAEKSYFIDGNSSQLMFDGKMAYLREISPFHIQPIDSCEVIHGHFQMSGPVDSIICVSLFMGDDNYFPLVLENGEIKISIENTSVNISGTPLNDRLYRFLTDRDSIIFRLNELTENHSRMFFPTMSPFDMHPQLHTDEMEYIKVLDQLEASFIKDNYDNVLGITWFLELCRRTERRYGYPALTPQIQYIYDHAPKQFRRNRDIERYIKASCSY